MIIFMPIKTETPFKVKKIRQKSQFSQNSCKDSDYTVEAFLAALKHNQLSVFSYLSRCYVDKIDISMIPLPEGVCTPLLVGDQWDIQPPDCKSHTVLTFSKNGISFLHFYTKIEPDHVSKYKIYCIEIEYI